MLSFVVEPFQRHPLPCTTHLGSAAVLYEEPCIAFAKVSINTISLGLAGEMGTGLKQRLGWFGSRLAGLLAQSRLMQRTSYATHPLYHRPPPPGAHTSPREMLSHVKRLLQGGQGSIVQMQRLMERTATAADDGAGAGEGLAPVAEEEAAVADWHGKDNAGSWDWLRRSGDGEGSTGGAMDSMDWGERLGAVSCFLDWVVG